MTTPATGGAHIVILRQQPVVPIETPITVPTPVIPVETPVVVPTAEEQKEIEHIVDVAVAEAKAKAAAQTQAQAAVTSNKFVPQPSVNPPAPQTSPPAGESPIPLVGVVLAAKLLLS
jgi:hypothetical protein